MEEKDSKDAGRDHEDGQFDAFKDIQAPVALERQSRRHLRKARNGFVHRLMQRIVPVAVNPLPATRRPTRIRVDGKAGYRTVTA